MQKNKLGITTAEVVVAERKLLVRIASSSCWEANALALLTPTFVGLNEGFGDGADVGDGDG
jgi:hypothetical protein